MSTVDTSIFFFIHTIINSLLKNVLTKCVGQYFSKIYFFKKSLIVWHNLCPDIFSWFLFGQPLPIFVVLIFFRKKADFKNACCFLSSTQYFSDPEFSKITRMKYQWEISILRIKSRPTMIVNKWSNKKFVKVFVEDKISIYFWEKKMRPFWSHIQWREQLVGKTEIWPLWSTAAGDKEVVWLQKTNRGFYTRGIPFWGNLRPFSFS